MFEKIKIFFGKKKASIELKVSKKELSKDGEHITKWEENYLKTNNWKCPNCESGPFYESPPVTGLSTNIRCKICGQGYNVSQIGIDNIGIDEKYIDEQYLRSLKLKKIKQ